MVFPVRKRRVYLLTGYEPIAAAQHHHRFAREIKRFEKTWSVAASVGPLDESGHPITRWETTVSGPDWSTHTDVRLLAWDDIIAEDVDRPLLSKLFGYLLAAGDFVFSGTFFAYVRTYWRYTFFAVYPAFLLFVFTLASVWIGSIFWRWSGGWVAVFAPFVAIAAFLVMMRTIGRRVHLDYMLNDWIFAADLVHRRRATIEARIEAFADEIVAGVEAGDVDEVVVLAHSLGAVWMVEALSRALAKRPALGQARVPLSLVGVGSSILKIALHPSAGWLRESVKRVADSRLLWVEYDSHVDFICFYKRNTVETLGIETASKPIGTPIRLSRMLSEETWGRFRGNLLRVHRQYVMGNERRYLYDFHLIACGPFSFPEIAHSGEAIPRALGPDGSLARGEPIPVLSPE